MTTISELPTLRLHKTLHAPAVGTRTWSSRPHPDSASPLLATASSDKTANVWSMRDWTLLSTITGGHKRSIRCVGWKDYGADRSKRRRAWTPDPSSPDTSDPVILATGSFDADCGLWVWNRQRREQVPGAFEEKDFTNEEEDEEWHFSTLLTGPDSEIKDLKFSPAHYGANLLATCSRDKSVWVWEEVEPEEWETVAVLSEHTGDVKCVAWCEGATVNRGSLTKQLGGAGQDSDDEVVLGARELLASGSYDDTIRLHHDDEAEGDWITIAVLTGHLGTVWDVKFEPFCNLLAYPSGTLDEEVLIDWTPRLASCSDDMSIKIWSKVPSTKESEEKTSRLRAVRGGDGSETVSNKEEGLPPTGFSTARLPSVIRSNATEEKWIDEATLPIVHVRSIYAIDWSAQTGLIVSCGGEGLIAVYQEVPNTLGEGEGGVIDGPADVKMDGTDDAQGTPNESDANTSTSVMKKVKMKWEVMAVFEAAHDEFEINHVCWAPVRDKPGDPEICPEYIISSGDDGQVRVWELPKELYQAVKAPRI